MTTDKIDRARNHRNQEVRKCVIVGTAIWCLWRWNEMIVIVDGADLDLIGFPSAGQRIEVVDIGSLLVQKTEMWDGGPLGRIAIFTRNCEPTIGGGDK